MPSKSVTIAGKQKKSAALSWSKFLYDIFYLVIALLPHAPGKTADTAQLSKKEKE